MSAYFFFRIDSNDIPHYNFLVINCADISIWILGTDDHYAKQYLQTCSTSCLTFYPWSERLFKPRRMIANCIPTILYRFDKHVSYWLIPCMCTTHVVVRCLINSESLSWLPRVVWTTQNYGYRDRAYEDPRRGEALLWSCTSSQESVPTEVCPSDKHFTHLDHSRSRSVSVWCSMVTRHSSKTSGQKGGVCEQMWTGEGGGAVGHKKDVRFWWIGDAILINYKKSFIREKYAKLRVSDVSARYDPSRIP